MDACPFCDPAPETVLFDTDLLRAIRRDGAIVLTLRRHVTSWGSATLDERQALTAAITQACEAQPNAVGYDARLPVGPSDVHLALQLTPRDTRHLVTGGDDPLLPHLQALVEQARRVDIAVAFVMPTGMDLVQPLLERMLHLGGSLRLICGDYLGISDPDALTRLLDLQADGDVQLRIYRPADTSFHPKAYLIADQQGRTTAFIGSSNLSGAALQAGIEWNYRLIPHEDERGLHEMRAAFDALFSQGVPLTTDWLAHYRERRQPPQILGGASLVAEAATAIEHTERPVPHSVQADALVALEATRRGGNRAGLVVLATGLGKTYLAAFDSETYGRVLFVAHRDEILTQARDAFRRIRPTAALGLYTGSEKTTEADVLFASIQTLGKPGQLKRFARDRFDYIIVDEFHHAAAPTYRLLIEHFQPRFLLALTATPDRTDGADLLSLCWENEVFRCDLPAGITRELLCPFHYYGVGDLVDYSNIPWRNGRFEVEALEARLAINARAENALEHLQRHGGQRTLAFCCSQRHADFMSDFFQRKGLRSVAVHSGLSSAPRTLSLERLREGQLDVICCVDIFNEGLDLPAVDTVLMLRPTESRIIWFQQFGRGLRKAAGKSYLTVIDYIGNHKMFKDRPGMVLSSTQPLLQLIDQLRAGVLEDGLPPGCQVTYDVEAIDILDHLVKQAPPEAFVAYYEQFRDIYDRRPTASEMIHAGYSLKAASKSNGSWLRFVEARGDLTPEQSLALQQGGALLNVLETTAMTKSYKMVLLLALMNLTDLPGSASVDALTEEFAAIAAGNVKLRENITVSLDDAPALRRLLLKNPFKYWTEPVGAFRLADGLWHCDFALDAELAPALTELARELVNWRLAEYLTRAEGDFVLDLSRSGTTPCLKLDRTAHKHLPEGKQTLFIEDQPFQANFGRNELKLVQANETSPNVLPRFLRTWFGIDAGAPGTRHRVSLRAEDDAYRVEPVAPNALDAPVVGKTYPREQIPLMFGLPFNAANWNQGYVKGGKHIFLLVTLDKAGMAKGQEYADRWLSPDVFEWHSQNRTKRDSGDGRIIRNHESLGFHVHLFVRADKLGGFRYEGELKFRDWEGNSPIIVRWTRFHQR